MYTFVPKQPHAKLSSHVRISTAHSKRLCALIRGKKLSTAKRLLEDLVAGRRALNGKQYTKTAREMLKLLRNCEANARSLNLAAGQLFVHTSSHKGPVLRRARRRAGFGSKMKSTNIEIALIQRGKAGR